MIDKAKIQRDCEALLQEDGHNGMAYECANHAHALLAERESIRQYGPYSVTRRVGDTEITVSFQHLYELENYIKKVSCDVPVTELSGFTRMSSRTRKALRRSADGCCPHVRIVTGSDFKRYVPVDLLDIKGLGQKALEEVKRFVSDNGLSWREVEDRA